MALEFSFSFPLPLGLHARPAGLIQEKAEHFQAEILWENHRDGITADAKSVLSLVGSDTQYNDPCRIRISGPAEKEALQALRSLVLDELPIKEAEAEQFILAAPKELPRILTLEHAVFFLGTPAGPGVARGRALIHDPVLEVDAEETETECLPEKEKKAFLMAVQSLDTELRNRQEENREKTERAVIQAHLSILRDRAFAAKVIEIITVERRSAFAAVALASRLFSEMLQASRSQYLRERMADIRDVSRQLIARISGIPAQETDIKLREPAILVDEDLAPSRFLSLDRNLLQGLILENAGVTSHTLIMCRARGIPAVTGCPGILQKLQSGEDIILDGERGLVIPVPSPAVGRYFERETDAEKRRNALRCEKAMLPGETADGREVEIAANISDPEELQAAWNNGAEAVGLFRTELLLMERQASPDEEEQYALYSRLAREGRNRPIIIRTFDIGGDKPVPFLPLPPENNPFLGFRGIRIYEQYPDLIRAQLRALLRAAAGGPLKIMFPMVSIPEEIVRMKELLRKILEELAAGSVPYRANVEIGMMVEVPSAALLIDHFSEYVDFFSVGSNDLLQYFLAADRGNPSVRHLNQPFHPAFLRLLKSVVDESHARGKWIGLCGEIAGSARMLPLLVGLGFDELSMSYSSIPEIKSNLRTLASAECRRLAETAVKLSLGREVEALLDSFRGIAVKEELITPRLIRLHSDSRSKAEALQELAIMMEAAERVDSRADFESALWQREDTFSTGIGFRVAIPHCQTSAVGSAAIAFLRFDAPMDWSSSDGKPVDMAVMLAIPASGHSQDHLKLLARLSRRLVHEEFREQLRTAGDEEAILHLIAAAIAE